MTTSKLSSGKWKCRVYDSSTKKQKTFIGDTKCEAEYLACKWALEHERNKEIEIKTISMRECIQGYIKSKNNVLSPSTVNGYNIAFQRLSDSFLDTDLTQMNQIIIQNEVNRLAEIYSSKTVYNTHGLISATLHQYKPEIILHTALPQKQRKIKDLPSPDIVMKAFKDSSIELPVLLGLWCGLRMSEIRGLKKSDFVNGYFTINRVIVTVNSGSIEKTNAKTTNSNRRLRTPPQIQALVDKVDTEYLTTWLGSSITRHFKRVMKEYGYPDITFHDLRHLNASIMLALGVPDKYAMERGGWSTTSTLKNVYQQTFSEERKLVDEKIDDYFNSVYENIRN